MQFHITRSVFLYFGMTCVQLALTSACVSSSHPLESKPPTPPQEAAARVTKISNLPATDAWYSVQFVTENEAFLSMSKGLWRSIDGGRNWQIVHRPPDFWGSIVHVYFLDTDVGFMRNNNGWYKSGDGGQTWLPFVTPLSSSGRLSDVQFINRSTGWIAGAALRSPSREELKWSRVPNVPRHLLDDVTGKVLTPIIYRTDDGGKTWQVQRVPSSLGNIEDISFKDSDHGVALSGPSAFHTRNGGKTWLDVDDPRTCVGDQVDGAYEGAPSWAYLLNSFYQWIAFDDGRMLRSTNDGQTWIEQQPCDQTRPVVIHFSTQNRGQGLGSDGYLYETTDGGTKWVKVGTDKYGSLSFLDNQHVWLLSENGLFRISLDQ